MSDSRWSEQPGCSNAVRIRCLQIDQPYRWDTPPQGWAPLRPGVLHIALTGLVLLTAMPHEADDSAPVPGCRICKAHAILRDHSRRYGHATQVRHCNAVIRQHHPNHPEVGHASATQQGIGAEPARLRALRLPQP